MTKIFICLALLCHASLALAQDQTKTNAIELHPWQRWQVSGHDSNCLGLSYVKTIASQFDLCVETGLRFINRKLVFGNSEVGYLSLGSRVYFKKSRTFNAELHFLYDNKTFYESDQKLGIKVGAGYTFQISDAIHANINGGLLMDIYNGAFYVGLGLGHRF